jgi:hypothetical protein
MDADDSDTLARLEEHAREFYDSVWADWYGLMRDGIKATLSFFLVDEPFTGDGNAGYSHSRNEIRLPQGGINLEGYRRDGFENSEFGFGWPLWKTELVHEMLHEWQRKKPCIPTADAERLNRAYTKHFVGDGHGDDYYQAVLEKAGYFGFTPEQLLEHI